MDILWKTGSVYFQTVELQSKLRGLRAELVAYIATIDEVSTLPPRTIELLGALGIQLEDDPRTAAREIVLQKIRDVNRTALAEPLPKTPIPTGHEANPETPPGITGKRRKGHTYRKRSGYKAHPTTRYLHAFLATEAWQGAKASTGWDAILAHFHQHYPTVTVRGLKAAIRRSLLLGHIELKGDQYRMVQAKPKQAERARPHVPANPHPTQEIVKRILLGQSSPISLVTLVEQVQNVQADIGHNAVRAAVTKCFHAGTVKKTVSPDGTRMYSLA